jgi:membrane protein involved in colicin uptake
MHRLFYVQMNRAFLVFAVLIATPNPARCQAADTSSYNYPAGPSMLDTLGQIQRLELQRQQIEMQRMQIEQQRLQMQQSEQRQREFERQQAELYRQRQSDRAKGKKGDMRSSGTQPLNLAPGSSK